MTLTLYSRSNHSSFVISKFDQNCVCACSPLKYLTDHCDTIKSSKHGCQLKLQFGDITFCSENTALIIKLALILHEGAHYVLVILA